MMNKDKEIEKAIAKYKRCLKKPIKKNEKFFSPPTGNKKLIVSTGSTLLDLAISGLVVYGGGIPAGILFEISGPPNSGKTVLLAEIAGRIQNLGGEITFNDPEYRLEKNFIKIFGLDINEKNYKTPDTVPEIFDCIRKFKPKNKKVVNGFFNDSLAALSTDTELEKGDKMGMRRAKEFSQELRITCRTIAKKNYIVGCSNQLRDSGGLYSGKVTPGGNAIPFYSSLRLSISKIEKIVAAKTIKGKKFKKIIGVRSLVTVTKSSIGEPFGSAPVFIDFRYGIDDIRANLEYLKAATGSISFYYGGKDKLNDAIANVENRGLESKLRDEVIEKWLEIQNAFMVKRKPKVRF